jgi:peptidyl-prolyl cis-trans isomerase B (cyclophilin B)
MKKYLTILLLLPAMLLTLSGCFMFDMPSNPVWDYDFTEMRLVQLEPPRAGQPIVTIYTELGEITAMLFPEYAPNTVANFIARIEDGFYTDKPVIALVESEFMFTGAYDEEGQQGMTDDGRLIPNEHSVNLWPFKGAMLAFSGRQGFGDSRFLIISGAPLSDADAEALRNTEHRNGTKLFPEELIKAFEENESLPGEMGRFTVFGQMTDGFDVLDEILSLPTDPETGIPLERFLIQKIELSYYSQ